MRFVRCALIGLLLASCGPTTTIEQSWRAPTARSGELTNVVALVNMRDGVLRRSSEDELAAHLQRRGMRAVPAYSVLRADDLQDPDRVAAVLGAAGYDGVVTMRFVGVEQENDYGPSYHMYWGDTWDGYLPETIVRIEISAYAIDGHRLVWSALSKSVDPGDVHHLIDDVTALASRELDRQRVIARSMSAAR